MVSDTLQLKKKAILKTMITHMMKMHRLVEMVLLKKMKKKSKLTNLYFLKKMAMTMMMTMMTMMISMNKLHLPESAKVQELIKRMVLMKKIHKVKLQVLVFMKSLKNIKQLLSF